MFGVLALLAILAAVINIPGLVSLMQQGAGNAPVPGVQGPGNPNGVVLPAGRVPPISQRSFSTGSVQSTVSGDLTFNVDLSLDNVRSNVDSDGLAWIAF